MQLTIPNIPIIYIDVQKAELSLIYEDSRKFRLSDWVEFDNFFFVKLDGNKKICTASTYALYFYLLQFFIQKKCRQIVQSVMQTFYILYYIKEDLNRLYRFSFVIITISIDILC